VSSGEPIHREPESGSVVAGRFVLLELLGEGGTARVFRAEDRLQGGQVALKLLVARYRGREERERRLLDEVEYLRRIGHSEHVVRLVAGGRADDHDGWPFVATELLDGHTLSQHKLSARALPVERVVTLARQLAEAVRDCHRADVVHRDLTPANVMVLGEPERDGCTLRLFDFSHAGSSLGPRLPIGHPDRLTREFEVPGTHRYMSPEQARAHPAAAAMDVYAFAVVLWEMITGENPFGSIRERQEFIAMQRSGQLAAPRLLAWTYQIPEPLAELVNDCLVHDPQLRPSMNVVVRRLDRLLGELALARPVESTVTVTKTEAISPAELARARGEPPGDDDPTLRRALRPGFAQRSSVGPELPPVLVESSPKPLFAREGVAPVVLPEPPLREDSSAAPPLAPPRAPIGLLALLVVLALALAAWWMLGRDAEPREPGSHAEPQRIDGDATPSSPSTSTSTSSTTSGVSETDESSDGESSDSESSDTQTTVESDENPGAERLAPSPDHRSAECAKVRGDAERALAATQWSTAERLARRSACWSSQVERLRIRVQALAQAERYAECVRIGEAAQDKEIRKWVNICRLALP
jgi:serine/threonine protein kinase